MKLILSACSSLAMVHALPADRLPVWELMRDNTVVTQSCVIRIPAGAIIPDADTTGVLQIGADNVTVRFERGSMLRGASTGHAGDELTGIGIRISGHRGVKIEDARVEGFKNGLAASSANELRIQGGDFSGNYRRRLKSTAAKEDPADWLYPHRNDETCWRDEYGGAVCIEASTNVIVRGIRVRRGQNGILLDRVEAAAIYDNDCSFLSGWGVALWRSSRNLISRNAFDFCVRGHVEGVYNRGQDSAGILCFEQSNDNVFAENSATHCGDGFFGFAGREAIGELWMNQERERLRRETGQQNVDALIQPPAELIQRLSNLGCNRNLLVGNDFSYASAHGIEMTFSEGNRFVRNRLVENAICGIWGGYCSGTLIYDNEIAGNGGMAYGLESGGINMEHAANNLMLRNRFLNNKCAVHLWWDNDAGLLRLPGVAGAEQGVCGNIIARNRFVVDANAPFPNLKPEERLVVLRLRDAGSGRMTNNLFLDNRVKLTHPRADLFAVQAGCEPVDHGKIPAVTIPSYRPLGHNRPVGHRKSLRGRSQIKLDEWGPLAAGH